MLCHIEKGTVFLDGFAADAYQCRRACEAEITAVGAGRGKFVDGFGFVPGMRDVEFFKFFGYHSGFLYLAAKIRFLSEIFLPLPNKIRKSVCNGEPAYTLYLIFKFKRHAPHSSISHSSPYIG